MTIYRSHIPYTYLIGWSSHNKWYYGVRYAKNCNPSDLWKTYFTSSDYVTEFRKLHGEPDVIQIRKTFIDPHTAICWEDNVHRKMNVSNDSKWLNRCIGNGRLLSEESIKKIKTALTGKKHSEEHCRNQGLAKKGIKQTSDHRRKRSDVQKGRSQSPEHSKKISESLKGKKKPKIECPHCGNWFAAGNAKYWHFDNCKHKL